MLPKIDDYARFIGREKVEKIKDITIKLEEKHIANFNSTYTGGGVAEILNSLVVLMNTSGVKTDWRLLKGSHMSLMKSFSVILFLSVPILVCTSTIAAFENMVS